MRRIVFASLLLATAANAAPPETHSFQLYKWQQRIGREDVLVAKDEGGATDIRTVFTFTDRTTPVPMSAEIHLGKDGAVERFALWGSTARPTRVDDRVVVSGKNLVVTQRGETRTVAAPALFFVGSAYAPVAVVEAMLQYWATHGKPARLPVFPIGEVNIVSRGEDEITDELGKPRKLTRYAVGGLQWGQQTVWIDDKGGVAALKGVDAEFDHFEATAVNFGEPLSKLVARSAEDGMASLSETSAPLRVGSAGKTAYVNAHLIDATGRPPVDGAVVLVDGERIVAAGAKVAVPVGFTTVDVGGKTILPGLWDMHAHFEQVEWGPLYLAAGVTTVRDCGNELDFIRAVRDTVAAGKGVGPRILMACIVDSPGVGTLGIDTLRNPEDIPPLVAKFKNAGCNQVKIYQSLDPKLIAPLARAAHAAGMTVTGHIPNGIGAVAAVQAGMDMINHAHNVVRAFLAPGVDPAKNLLPSERYQAFDSFDLTTPAARKVAAVFAARKTVIDPTLALADLFAATREELLATEPGFARLPAPIAAAYASAGTGMTPERIAFGKKVRAATLATIAMLHKLGVPIVTGTDQAVPGFSEHREMEIYVEAGLTPMEAIQAATLVPARAMKLDKDSGTVQAGKRADLIIVDGDPLADIKNLRKIVMVVAAGVAYDPDKLWTSVGFKPGP